MTKSLIPKTAIISHRGATQDTFHTNQSHFDSNIIYICIKNSANYQSDIKKNLKRTLGKQWAKKLSTRLHKPTRKMVSKNSAQSGVLNLKMSQGVLKMFHYLVRFKDESVKYIELFLINMSTDINLKKITQKYFKKTQRQYRKSIKTILSLSEIQFLKLIGKGNDDYTIEKKLNLHQVELISLKERLVNKLQLRQTNELYWIAQRAGYIYK